MSTATIALNGEFTATELDEIIRDLAEARASLEPAVPTQPPTAESGTQVLEQNDPLFTVRTLADGGLRIWLRSEGMGWLAFRLNTERREALAAFLAKEPGHTHTSH